MGEIGGGKEEFRKLKQWIYGLWVRMNVGVGKFCRYRETKEGSMH